MMKAHGCLGQNVKVHFAGTDYSQSCLNSLEMAGVKYRLYTVYPAIVDKKKDDDFTDASGTALRCERIFNHVILDSGLFTLMFGAKKEQKQTLGSIIDWQDKIIEFVQQNGLNCTCVETDCQKLLGTEAAWQLRERMRRKLKNRQINVFHWEDGKEGLDRLIEFSDYIAISVPEIRLLHKKTFREVTHRLAVYVKNKKPEIDIHLLVCTDKTMLRQNRFCTSADSSSWTGVYRFGSILGKSAYSMKKEVYEDAERRWKQFAGADAWDKFPPITQRKNVWELVSAEIHKAVYTKYAGEQN